MATAWWWSSWGDVELGGCFCHLAARRTDIRVMGPVFPDEAASLAAARRAFGRLARPGDILVGRIGGGRRRALAAKGEAGTVAARAVNVPDHWTAAAALARLDQPFYQDILHIERPVVIVDVDGTVNRGA